MTAAGPYPSASYGAARSEGVDETLVGQSDAPPPTAGLPGPARSSAAGPSDAGPPGPDGPQAGPPFGAPPVPAGPGVAPPFTAPPVDRSQRSLWIGLIAGALAVVICCAGGLFGFGVLSVASTDQAEREARKAVNDFVAALSNEDYQAAFAQMCGSFTRRSTVEAIETEFGGDEITGHRIGAVQVGNTRLTADVEIQYADRGARSYRFTLVADGTRMRVCGWQ